MIIYRYCPNDPKVFNDCKEAACYEFALAQNWSDHPGNTHLWTSSVHANTRLSLKKAVHNFGLEEVPENEALFKFHAYFSVPNSFFDHIWFEYNGWVYDTAPNFPIRRMREEAGTDSVFGPCYALRKRVDNMQLDRINIAGPICVKTVSSALHHVLTDTTLGRWVEEYNSAE